MKPVTLAGIALGLAFGSATMVAAQQAPPAVPAFTSQSRLIAGGGAPSVARTNPYAGDRAAIAEGKRLYDWFNCSGCHAGGGGGMGPPLMDSTWIYGREHANLFDVITEGRPGGMPSFGGRIPEAQIWQIIAFIESLGGMAGSGATRAEAGR